MSKLRKIVVKGVEYELEDARVDQLQETVDNIEIPVLTDLIDDTQPSATTVYSSNKVMDIISNLTLGITIQVVEQLPALSSADQKVIYLIRKTSTEVENVYDEYICVGSGNNKSWEKIGDTTIDLSEYIKETVAEARYVKQTTLTNYRTAAEIQEMINNSLPTIPTVNDGVLTINVGGVPYTFRANQAANQTITIPSPPAQVNADWNSSSGASEILNKPQLKAVATSGSYNDLINKPTIPDAQIQSDWNQTDVTAKDYIKNKPSTLPARVIDASSLSGGVLESDATANEIIVLTGTNPQTTYTYTNNRGITKHLTGNVDYDIMFRCCGNNRYQPITLPIPID